MLMIVNGKLPFAELEKVNPARNIQTLGVDVKNLSLPPNYFLNPMFPHPGQPLAKLPGRNYGGLVNWDSQRAPEDRLMHNPDSVLSRLLCFARLSVWIGHDQEVQFLCHRRQNPEAFLYRKLLGHFTSNELTSHGATALTGEAHGLSSPLLDKGCTYIGEGGALAGAQEVVELIVRQAPESE